MRRPKHPSWGPTPNLAKKQNAFDDISAVIQHVQTTGYTAPDRTAILGGSNCAY